MNKLILLQAISELIYFLIILIYPDQLKGTYLMDNNQELNLEPLDNFLTLDIKPKDLSKLLDELIYDYISLVLQHRLSGDELHENTLSFVYYLKELRDLLPKCEK